jgi:hypothetical protein
MQNYIINSFFIKNINTINNIYEYLKIHYNNLIEINDIKTELHNLIKNKIIFVENKNYHLTIEGNVILSDHKYYYSIIIIRFYKKYNKNHKKYALKEIRLEQQSLRKFLINNKKHECIICDKKLPLCLLETAHLKPRCLLKHNEKIDKCIVEFMCRYCHNLYDNGYLGISNGILCISGFIQIYDLNYEINKLIIQYNIQNKIYFDFHYKYIYKK